MIKRQTKRIITLLIGGVIFLCGSGGVGLDRTETRAISSEAFTKAEETVAAERMSGYTTYFDKKVAGRSENIRLAAALIDGIIVQAYGEFSFNQVVGERTKERGFQEANVIVKGEYVSGVGGGVCQVSTTLYNAALYAGLTVTEYHPHTLAVGYVPPSQDAMVSAYHDFAFFNPYEFPVKIVMQTEEGAVRARVYGKRTGVKREVVSRITGKTPPPAPRIVEGEKEEVLRAEKWGLVSESYLETYKDGVLLGRKLLRKDAYAPTQAIIVKKTSLLGAENCAK